MPTDAPDGLLNQHVVTGSAKARKARSAEPKKAPDDDGNAAPSKSDKAK